MNLARLPLMLASGVLLIVGAYRMATDPNTPEGVALLTAGLMVLGAWSTLEAVAVWDSRRHGRLEDEGKS